MALRLARPVWAGTHPAEVPDDNVQGAAPEAEAAAAPEQQHTKALDIVVHYLRLVCSWPEGRGRLAGLLGVYVLPYSFVMTMVPGMVYFGLGENSSNVEIFGLLADALGSSLCLVKMVHMQRHTGTLMMVRDILDSFTPMERSVVAEASQLNDRCERRSNKMVRRYVRLYSIISVTAIMGMTVSVIRDEPEGRWLPVKTASFIMQSRILYIISAIMTAVEMYVFPVAIGLFDGLLVTISLHIACKCDVLVLLLRQAVTEDPSKADVNDGAEDLRRLRLCAVYHQTIIRLHHAAESIFSTIALCQIFYTLFGLGTPLFRMLSSGTQEVATVEIVFSAIYVNWTFCQLFTFCYFGDIVAASTARLSWATYASFHPSLSGRDHRLGRIQHMMPMRAQAPLFLTAGRFTNLTLHLFQDIMRRSYSLYSTVLRMR